MIVIVRVDFFAKVQIRKQFTFLVFNWLKKLKNLGLFFPVFLNYCFRTISLSIVADFILKYLF